MARLSLQQSERDDDCFIWRTDQCGNDSVNGSVKSDAVKQKTDTEHNNTRQNSLKLRTIRGSSRYICQRFKPGVVNCDINAVFVCSQPTETLD